jgi:cell division protein FtsB
LEDLRAKEKFRKALYSRASFVILILITVFLVRGALGVLAKKNESKERLVRAEMDLASAIERENELNSSIERLNTKDGIEEEIRSKFSVAKPGEEIVVIVDAPNSDDGADKKDSSLWGRIKGWFSSIFN